MKLQEEHHEFILDDELKRHEVICNQVVLGGIWGDVAEIVPKNWGGGIGFILAVATSTTF